MKTYLKIILLFLISIVLYSCFNLAAYCGSIPGKYYDVSDSAMNHYLKLNEDGTFLHYCKKEGLEYSHKGKWWEHRNYCVIELDNWEVYGVPILKQLDGFNGAKFGSGMGNMMFWPTRKYLEISPDGGGGFVKEKYAKKYFKEKEEDRIQDSIYWATKDTLFYTTGEIKAIGKIADEGRYHKKDSNDLMKRGIWKQYYKNGQLKSIGWGGDNQKSKLWKFYYETGELQMIGGYENGVKKGPWEYYHKNGELKESGIYMYIGNKELKRDLWRFYNRKGQLIKKIKYPSRKKSLDSLFRSWGMKSEFMVKNINKSIERTDRYYNEYKKLEKEVKKEK